MTLYNVNLELYTNKCGWNDVNECLKGNYRILKKEKFISGCEYWLKCLQDIFALITHCKKPKNFLSHRIVVKIGIPKEESKGSNVSAESEQKKSEVYKVARNGLFQSDLKVPPILNGFPGHVNGSVEITSNGLANGYLNQSNKENHNGLFTKKEITSQGLTNGHSNNSSENNPYAPYTKKELVQAFKNLNAKSEKLNCIPDHYFNYNLYKSCHRLNDIFCPQQTAVQMDGMDDFYFLHANQVNIEGNQFIATQYPILGIGFYWFWKMALQKSALIVDLTNDEDKKLRGMNSYYPESKEKPVCFSGIKIELIQCDTIEGMDDVFLYKYAIEDENGFKKEISRLHMKCWPDHQCTNLEKLFKVMDFINANQNAEGECPIIHCRAGVGRTGTLITLLIAKEMILKGLITEDNLLEKLEEIIYQGRVQRNEHYVQNIHQFDLIVKGCLELLHKEVPKNNEPVASKKGLVQLKSLHKTFAHQKDRYFRGSLPSNPDTAVKLTDGKSTYPANKITLFPCTQTYIMAESPRGSVNTNWNTDETIPNIDAQLYYEMAYSQNAGTLISAGDVYDNQGEQVDACNFLQFDQSKEFKMLNGEKVNVKCFDGGIIAISVLPKLETRHLFMKSEDATQTREICHWIIRGGFSYPNRGLSFAYNFYKHSKESPGAVIVDCNNGLDRSSALIMWMSIFELLDEKKLTVEQITHEYLKKVAMEFESQSTSHALIDHVENAIPLYFDNDKAIQDAVQAVLAK